MKAASLAMKVAWCAATVVLSTAGVHAEDVLDTSEPAAQAKHRASFGPAVSEAELAAHSGGADVQLNEIRAKAVVSDNYAGNLMTGNNTISDNAFGNTAGVPMVVQNTGNNVSIQNSTILNLKLH